MVDEITVAVLCCASIAAAQFPSVFDLADVDGQNAKLFMGVLRNSITGYPATTGDLNGDGFPDLLIGASSPGNLGIYADDFPGTVYIVFGGTTFDAFDIVGLETLARETGFRIVGPQPAAFFGIALTAGFDWNDDGFEDYLIAAPGNRVEPNNDAGQVYVLFGRNPIGGLVNVQLTHLDGLHGFQINGTGFLESLGAQVAIGDFNGDGWIDLALPETGRSLQGRGRAGRTYVIFGGPDVGMNGVFDLATLDGSNGYVILGIAAGDLAGRWLAAGDLNGDGIDDLELGAPNVDPNGLNDAGQSYVVFGGPHVGDKGVVELSDLNGTNGFVVNGARENDFASHVNNAGDVNGDGIDDLAVGHEGGVALIYGGHGVGASGVIDIATLAWPVGVRLLGQFVRQNSGSAGIGDVNADGFDDITLTIPRDSPLGRNQAGRISVIYGSSTLGMAGSIDADSLDGSDGFFIYGNQTFLRIGTTYPLGDMNGDGVDDFGVYGNLNRPIQVQPEGGLYVIFGQRQFAQGDFDMDGDVDLSDFSQFALCFAGANVPPAPTCPMGIDADFDNDGDVDLSDFSMFALNFTGPM